MRYCLASDDDGHWYVIPAEKRDEWENWVQMPESTDYEAPSYAIPVDGHPTWITFERWKQE